MQMVTLTVLPQTEFVGLVQPPRKCIPGSFSLWILQNGVLIPCSVCLLALCNRINKEEFTARSLGEGSF